ncbi:M48 family metallopeptidase, partial [Bacteriovoracaceae bacterium]|nr:M48 family metallopeptidase [Bacteriovoracaceae bacterium]
TLDGLNSLTDCEGKELEDYSIYSIGARNLGSGFPLNTVSPAVDRFLGESFSRSFVRANRDIVLEGGPLVDFLQKKMNLIWKNSDSFYNNSFTPRVRVIHADIVNAFALPGGDIYVFTGLIKQSPNIDSLMGVLAHEWAHVVARHGISRMLRTYSWIASSFLVDASLYTISRRNNWNYIIADAIRATGGLLIQSKLLGKSREAEAEADLFGSQYLYQSGYSPMGISSFFKSMQDRSPRPNSKLVNTLSTHPHPLMRVEAGQIFSSYFMPPLKKETSIDEEYFKIKKIVHEMGDVERKKGSSKRDKKVANSFVNHLERMNHRFLMDQINDYIYYSSFYRRGTRNGALRHFQYFNQ